MNSRILPARYQLWVEGMRFKDPVSDKREPGQCALARFPMSELTGLDRSAASF